MKSLPPTDPRSWDRQVQLHNTRCRHASWLFLPWHRAYVYHFEAICRELIGDPTFALPYWDWTARPQIPSMFFDPTSPLYFAGRAASPGSTAGPAFVGPAVVERVMAERNFLVVAGAPTAGNDPNQYGAGYGLVEESLHNYVHGFVGGAMSTFVSPEDPIFWTHHNRIDQLWVEWNIGRGHPVTDDPAFLDTEFTEFCDGHGRPVTMTVRDTLALPLSAYRFDTQPATGGTAPIGRVGLAALGEVAGTVVSADPDRVVVTFPGRAATADLHLVFEIGSAAGPPNGAVLVSVGDTTVGSVAFFAHDGHIGHGQVPFRLPLPAGLDPLTVTFAPVGFPDRPGARPTLDAVATLVRTRSTVDAWPNGGEPPPFGRWAGPTPPHRPWHT